MNKKGIGNWIWRVVILIIVILFIVGFYLLLSGGSFPNFFDSDGDSGDSNSGSWLDNLGGSDEDNDAIPSPPALPS